MNFLALSGGTTYVETTITQLAPGDDYEVTIYVADAASAAGCTADVHANADGALLCTWACRKCFADSTFALLSCNQMTQKGFPVWETNHPAGRSVAMSLTHILL